MTAIPATPPALRWVALFLVACAALGLFLGFRDQIRRNPPDWYTGSERAASSLPVTPDGIQDAAPFDGATLQAPPTADVVVATVPAQKPAAPEPTPEPEAVPAPAPSTPARTAQAAAPTPKPKPAQPKAAPSADPVGDILESQRSDSAPPVVPY
ncbi:MAG: hypothetical protein Q8L66_01580 [Caulobacter sp.]|nr:hypothetical protein [Caulobacter sp.]